MNISAFVQVLTVVVLAGLCVPAVYAQEPTLTPTPSLSAHDEPTPTPSPGPVTGSNAIEINIQSTDVNVGDAVVPVPGGGCVKKVYEALANHAPVLVTEPECASAMDKALRLVLETCRRLDIPVRKYLGTVLPGLAAVSLQKLAELTPAAWAARNR